MRCRSGTEDVIVKTTVPSTNECGAGQPFCAVRARVVAAKAWKNSSASTEDDERKRKRKRKLDGDYITNNTQHGCGNAFLCMIV